MEPIEFQLVDTNGDAHEYTCTPHKAGDGTRLCLRVLGMAGEPIGRIASSNLSELIELFAGLDLDPNAEDAELESAFDGFASKVEGLDLDLGAIIRDLQAAIADAGDDQFFRSVLKHTYRDGKPVAKNLVFDQAYQANYMELFQAVWKVIQANGFLPFWGIS